MRRIDVFQLEFAADGVDRLSDRATAFGVGTRHTARENTAAVLTEADLPAARGRRLVSDCDTGIDAPRERGDGSAKRGGSCGDELIYD